MGVRSGSSSRAVCRRLPHAAMKTTSDPQASTLDRALERSGLLFVSEGDARVGERSVKCVTYRACGFWAESLTHPVRDAGGVHFEMHEADGEIVLMGWHRLGCGFRGWRDWSLLTESS